MGKLTPEPLVPQRTHSGRSYWVRNIGAPAKGNVDPSHAAKGASQPNPPPAEASRHKKRFVEPYRLTDEQRAAVLAPLAERGIGDPESRELFAAALSYDLATCYELTVVRAEPEQSDVGTATTVPEATPVPRKSAGRKTTRATPPNPALAALAETARQVTAQLGALEAPVRAKLLEDLGKGDRFRRGYDESYLAALSEELLRLVASIGTDVASEEPAAEPAPAQPPKPAAPPPPSPAARQFIARAAGAYDQCFDQAPTAQAGGPFVALLRALVEITGIRIPTDVHNLAALLKGV